MDGVSRFFFHSSPYSQFPHHFLLQVPHYVKAFGFPSSSFPRNSGVERGISRRASFAESGKVCLSSG